MNKDKLIGLIIKKDTYKETKVTQADIQRKKQQAVTVSIAAISQVLKDDYNAQAKLYAVRYLKDCFEKGNESFISKTENKILPLLVKFVKDADNQQQVMKYGGSYTKASQLQKFKTLVTSLFTISRECIQKWAMWIPDTNREFIKAQKQVSAVKNDPKVLGFSYFRQEHDDIFRENCEKNGLKLNWPANKIQKPTPVPNTSSNINSTAQKGKKSDQKAKVLQIIKQMQNKVMMNSELSEKQLQNLEGKLNTAVNEYIEQAQNFDEAFIQDQLQNFQNLKTKNQQIKREMQKAKAQRQAVKKQIIDSSKSQVQQFNLPSFNPGYKPEAQKSSSSKFHQGKDLDSTNKTFKQAIVSSIPLEKKEDKAVRPTQSKVQSSRMMQSFSKTKQQESRVRFDQSDSQQESSSRPAQTAVRNNHNKITAVKSTQKPHQENKPVQIFAKNQQIKQLTLRHESETAALYRKLQRFQSEIEAMKSRQNKIHDQYREAVSPKQVEALKKQLYQQKNDKYLLIQEITQLKASLKRMQAQFDTSKQILSQNATSNPQHEASGQSQQVKVAVVGGADSRLVPLAPQQKSHSETGSHEMSSGMKSRGNAVARIDEGYINMETHYDKIGSFLSSENLLQFKLSVLGVNDKFYQDEHVTISKKGENFLENEAEFLRIDFMFKFKRVQSQAPQVTIKNIAQVDLWTKPVLGDSQQFSQQIVARLCMVPLKIIKASLSPHQCPNRKVQYLLPLLYYNYLRAKEFELEQFDSIFRNKSSQVHKSKVFHLNPQVVQSRNDLHSLFRQSTFDGNFLKMCLSEGSEDRAFLVQIELLQNQKAVMRVLPIPCTADMGLRCRQIVGNLVFLLSDS